ncbi:MAG: ABC transporter ATP-binding protein [Opitutaceae bacterium]
MSLSPAVELQAVAKRFGDGPPVLEDISLRADSGEMISLLGPSGCGKSTLLRLIAGLTPATAGSLRVAGRPAGDPAASVAFVFQEATLLPWLTVRANVEVPLRLGGAAAPLRAATSSRLLELVGLGGRGEAYPRQLSGGQRMRVSLARALSLAPRLLLLDEPFGALDEMTRERLNEELLALQAAGGWTGFFVTHSVAEAVFLSHRILILSSHPGRLHAEVPVTLPHPRTAETRLHPDYLRLVAQVSRQLRAISPAG